MRDDGSLRSLLEILACPHDRSSLTLASSVLKCQGGHAFPVVDGVPVMLVLNEQQTHHEASRSIRDAYFPMLREERNPGPALNGVDGFVQKSIVLVAGQMYKPVVGRLKRYPVVNLELPPGNGQLFIDIGCNWGRWSLAAARLGYRVLGIDPNLEAIRSAQRIAAAEGVHADFIVGDGRFLPIKTGVVDFVFSYSVLQHFSKSDVALTLNEIRRVLGTSGRSLVQMASATGMRNVYQQARRRFREPSGFEVRYWGRREILETFSSVIGPTLIRPEAFFGLGIQRTDVSLLPLRYKAIAIASDLLRRAAEIIPPFARLADSVFVDSQVTFENPDIQLELKSDVPLFRS